MKGIGLADIVTNGAIGGHRQRRVVGFFNAWQLSGDEAWLNKTRNNWLFIKQQLIDREQGEWYWSVSPRGIKTW